MELMVDLKSNRFNDNLVVGGQIWIIDKEINLNRVKNLLNIVGKILSSWITVIMVEL